MAMRPARRRRHPRRLFVTGGSGLLGRHILNGPASEPWEVVAPPSASLDLRRRDGVIDTIRDWRPTAIIHTAYRRDDEASIVEASRNIAEAAARTGSRLVHVSTDALFAGRPEPYTEADPPTPVHDYGRWKAEAERIVLDSVPDAVVVRTSLLFAMREMTSHELMVRDAISGHRDDIAFFRDEVRSPVLVEDLAAVLVALADCIEPSGILHLAGPEPLSRSELAIMIARRHGWDATRLRFSTIAESGLRRPARVVLDSSLGAAHGLTVRGPTAWD